MNAPAALPAKRAFKNHDLVDDYAKPGIRYELKPARRPDGSVAAGLFNAWITLDNPGQFNSYTTDMVKGVILAFRAASNARDVNCVVFTGAGDRAFCTGGNTKEYAEYYAGHPQEYRQYMRLFNDMVSAILACDKPVICRVNGMRIGGGQEIGMACDFSVAQDMARFGQAGPKHGSAPDGGSTDFLPWMLNMEDAMYNCISCETWSAYKMKAKNLVTKVVPVLKKDGKWVRNPLVRTDTYVDDGEIVYGEPVAADKVAAAKTLMGECKTDFELLDAEVNRLVWKFANLFPLCLMKSIDGIRAKKKFFWDQMKLANRHWLAANMNHEAWLGFNAFDAKKVTGKDLIDFIKYRQLVAEGALFDDKWAEQVLAKPKG